MRDFRGLEVWQRAHRITLLLYRATAKFPREELYGLTSQIRRCSASIAANIAEGCGRQGEGEFNRFLQVASGSASELDYHLLLARDLEILPQNTFDTAANELSQLRRKLSSLIAVVRIQRRHTTAKG